MCKTKHAFVYDSHFKPLNKPKRCGDPIYNREYAHICVLEDKDRGTKINLIHSLISFGKLHTIEYIYKITPR